MWTAGYKYSWRKMEVAVQDSAGWRQVVWAQQGISQESHTADGPTLLLKLLGRHRLPYLIHENNKSLFYCKTVTAELY